MHSFIAFYKALLPGDLIVLHDFHELAVFFQYLTLF